MATKICPNCGAEVDINARFCPACGESLSGNFKPVQTSKDPFANQKYTQEDIINRNKEIEKGRKEIEKKEKKYRKEMNKKERKSVSFIFAIIAGVLALAGTILCFFGTKANLDWGVNLFSVTFKEISNSLWNNMVREFFTFLGWLICIVGTFIGFIFAFLAVSALGPTLIGLGLIAGIIQLITNKKRYSYIVLLVIAIDFMAFTLIYFTAIIR